MRLSECRFVGFLLVAGFVAIAALPWLFRLPQPTLHIHTVRIEEADIPATCLVRGEVETCTFTVPVER